MKILTILMSLTLILSAMNLYASTDVVGIKRDLDYYLSIGSLDEACEVISVESREISIAAEKLLFDFVSLDLLDVSSGLQIAGNGCMNEEEVIKWAIHVRLNIQENPRVTELALMILEDAGLERYL